MVWSVSPSTQGSSQFLSGSLCITDGRTKSVAVTGGVAGHPWLPLCDPGIITTIPSPPPAFLLFQLLVLLWVRGIRRVLLSLLEEPMLDSLAGIVLHFLLVPSTGFLAIRIPGIKVSWIKARLLPPHCGHCKTLFYRDPRAM